MIVAYGFLVMSLSYRYCRCSPGAYAEQIGLHQAFPWEPAQVGLFFWAHGRSARLGLSAFDSAVLDMKKRALPQGGVMNGLSQLCLGCCRVFVAGPAF
jgi:hypothetical protein